MIHQAAAELAIDLTRSYVVGDKIADVTLAANVGATAVLVKTGYGQAELQRHAGIVPGASYVAETLLEATGWILGEAGFPKERV